MQAGIRLRQSLFFLPSAVHGVHDVCPKVWLHFSFVSGNDDDGATWEFDIFVTNGLLYLSFRCSCTDGNSLGTAALPVWHKIANHSNAHRSRKTTYRGRRGAGTSAGIAAPDARAINLLCLCLTDFICGLLEF